MSKLTYSVIQLNYKVVCSLIRPKLKVHNPVHTQLSYMYQSPGLQVFSALKQHCKENIQQTQHIQLLLLLLQLLRVRWNINILKTNLILIKDQELTYFHSKTRGHDIFWPLKVCGVNSYAGLNQEDSFVVRPVWKN